MNDRDDANVDGKMVRNNGSSSNNAVDTTMAMEMVIWRAIITIIVTEIVTAKVA